MLKSRFTITGGVVAASSLVLSILAACSLTISPGEYAQGEPDASPQVSRPPVPPGGARLLLLAGQRELFHPKDTIVIQETAGAIVAADGTIGNYYYERAPPIATNNFAQAFVEDGKLVATGAAKVTFAPLDSPSGAVTGDWSVLDPDGSVQESSSTLLVRSSLLSLGGAESVFFEDGGRELVWNGNVLAANIDIGGRKAGQFVRLADPSLTVGRGQPRLIVHKDFLFVVAGRKDDVFLADVDVARLGADGTPGPFAATTALPAPMLIPTLAVAAGKLFAVGGLLDGYKTTSRVSYATINEDGTLGPWAQGPELPVALAVGATVVHSDKIYYIGGIQQLTNADGGATTNAPVDTIYALDVASDGTPGTWREMGKLPAPRAGLTAVIF